MNIASVKEKVKRFGYFIPFRLHFLLLVICLLLAGFWLKKNNALPETSRTAIISVFICVTLWFAISVLIMSFVSAFVPWLLFLINKKNSKAALKVKTSGTKNITDKQLVEVNISNVFKPLFGYLRVRLKYDKYHISPKFAPVTDGITTAFFSSKIKGIYNWPLKLIKEYNVDSGIIYFEDFFQFFSFATQLSTKDTFYIYPLKAATEAILVQPKKTDDTLIRIEEMRKVEGEFLNYKNFETNDDVRRIVWKIYAKNKELVVRIPETSDPYASHIYFFTSFYNNISNSFNQAFNDIFLNSYKTFVWNIYEQLYKQNENIKFIPDQQPKAFYADDELLKVKYMISTSAWQQSNEPLNYFSNQYGSVLCVSSLTDASQLQQIVDKNGRSLTVIFVKLSKSFSKIKITDGLRWIFVKPEKQGSERLQLAFSISPLKKKIADNEAQIQEMLMKSECETMILE